MTRDEIKSAVLRVIAEIAPEADPSSIDPQARFRDQLDIDSVDFLNFVIGLHKQFRVDIPEADYPQLATLDSCIQYLVSVTEARGPAD
ncbi:MAG TPA: acyl carrier protein [Blastocatellia bacterium]|jgi:acyl carrier protein